MKSSVLEQIIPLESTNTRAPRKPVQPFQSANANEASQVDDTLEKGGPDTDSTSLQRCSRSEQFESVCTKIAADRTSRERSSKGQEKKMSWELLKKLC